MARLSRDGRVTFAVARRLTWQDTTRTLRMRPQNRRRTTTITFDHDGDDDDSLAINENERIHKEKKHSVVLDDSVEFAHFGILL